MRTILLHLLLLAIPTLGMSQSTPTSVNRGAANLTQVDQYLTAAKRLGIPTSATDNLAATTSPQNTAKILYNTTLNKLRVYNPVTETWRDAIEADLTDYYTKEEIDILLGGKQNTLVSGTNIKTINGETLLGSGNIDIEGALYTATNGITISGSNVISPVYGTTAGTIAQGNDSRINNGNTAFGWGNHSGLYLPLTGGTLSGTLGVNLANSSTYNYAFQALAPTLSAGHQLVFQLGKSGSKNNRVSWAYHHIADGSASNYMSFFFFGASKPQLKIEASGATTFTGNVTAPTFSGALSGNATTATRLATARTINGTSFNGSANITTANWGTARNITIGKTGKSVNGSANVSWSLAEIGALPLTGGTVTGVIKSPSPVADEDLANKAYVDSKASPFNLIDVTQQAYTDKAINVGVFDNTGMTYSEGSIDFGVTRDATHTMGLYAFKQGFDTKASGMTSTAFGTGTEASGPASVAFGSGTTASGQNSSVFGNYATASGAISSAFGNETIASGDYSSAFGSGTTASGSYSSAFGNETIASGRFSSAFGSGTTASGTASSAFGSGTTASGTASSAFGDQSAANEYASLAIGRFSTGGTAQAAWVAGSPIFKVGNGTSPTTRSNAYVLNNDGTSTQYGIASYGADYSANFTDRSLVDKAYVDSKASPFNIIDVTQILYQDKAINVIPFNNTAMTYQEGAIDFGVTDTNIHEMGLYGFKVGLDTEASGDFSSAFGVETKASGENSSAFGAGTIASGFLSSAFGYMTEASGNTSSAFGGSTIASGDFSSAFGAGTLASGNTSSAFGGSTIASGDFSSAFGNNTIASGYYSSAFGYEAIANEYASLAIGSCPTDGPVETLWTSGSPIFKVGNGINPSNRSNAYVLYNDGRSEQIKDMEVTEIGQGFVLKSPDGTRWRITVDNSGNLITTAL